MEVDERCRQSHTHVSEPKRIAHTELDDSHQMKFEGLDRRGEYRDQQKGEAGGNRHLCSRPRSQFNWILIDTKPTHAYNDREKSSPSTVGSLVVPVVALPLPQPAPAVVPSGAQMGLNHTIYCTVLARSQSQVRRPVTAILRMIPQHARLSNRAVALWHCSGRRGTAP